MMTAFVAVSIPVEDLIRYLNGPRSSHGADSSKCPPAPAPLKKTTTASAPKIATTSFPLQLVNIQPGSQPLLTVDCGQWVITYIKRGVHAVCQVETKAAKGFWNLSTGVGVVCRRPCDMYPVPDGITLPTVAQVPTLHEEDNHVDVTTIVDRGVVQQTMQGTAVYPTSLFDTEDSAPTTDFDPSIPETDVSAATDVFDGRRFCPTSTGRKKGFKSVRASSSELTWAGEFTRGAQVMFSYDAKTVVQGTLLSSFPADDTVLISAEDAGGNLRILHAPKRIVYNTERKAPRTETTVSAKSRHKK